MDIESSKTDPRSFFKPFIEYVKKYDMTGLDDDLGEDLLQEIDDNLYEIGVNMSEDEQMSIGKAMAATAEELNK